MMGKKVSFDYSKLRGRIVEKCGTQTVFSQKVGLSMVSLGKKLNGNRSFKDREIVRIAEILGISIDEIPAYFFCVNNSVM